MHLRIVRTRGIAKRYGIRPGDELVSINGQAVADLIDYQFFDAQEELDVCIASGGSARIFHISKYSEEPLGMDIDEAELLKMRECANHCVFCFVDQLPSDVRPTLRVKDDDWRLSFIMGNYVTLTNVGPSELSRIAERKTSPLYISVHASDPELRKKLLGVKKSPNVMEQLKTLAQAGITAHCQIVLCPGLNDGEALERTLLGLAALYPGVRSVALVPVGLTGHRDGLFALRPFCRDDALRTLRQTKEWQARCLRELGARFAFAADELYLIAGKEPPPFEEYEDFPQIENGVGLLAKFEREVDDALAEVMEERREAGNNPISRYSAKIPPHYTLLTGISAKGFMERIAGRIAAATGVRLDVAAVANGFFGDTVTVAGLVTGKDIAAAMHGRECGRLLLPRCMLREYGDVFLCGMTLGELERELGREIMVIDVDGEKLIQTVLQ